MGALRDRGRHIIEMAVGAQQRGVQFLLDHQGEDGLWRDFDTPAGEASLWPTAFVATALQVAAIQGDALGRAADALAATQNDDGGWGYNEHVPSDADSTAWAVLFLSRAGRSGVACRRAAACLVRHQRPGSGGVATYATPGPIRRFMGLGRWVPFWGWCRPHTEVTAVAGRALAAAAAGGRDPAADAAWRFVRAQQDPTGAWTSYWWTSPHYATAQAVELAALHGATDAVARAAAWVRRDEAAVSTSAFATALSLSILGRAGAHDEEICRVVERLCDLQQADGGWPSRPIMRIPLPCDPAPNRAGRWRPVTFASGIDVSDQHRLFTSAACVAALTRRATWTSPTTSAP